MCEFLALSLQRNAKSNLFLGLVQAAPIAWNQVGMFVEQRFEFGELVLFAKNTSHAGRVASPLGGNSVDDGWEVFANPGPVLIAKRGFSQSGT